MAGKKRRRASLETRYFVGLGMGSTAEKRRVEADRRAFPEEYAPKTYDGPDALVLDRRFTTARLRASERARRKEQMRRAHEYAPRPTDVDTSNTMPWPPDERVHSHRHSEPSHHVGPCSPFCRRGIHVHGHRKARRR